MNSSNLNYDSPASIRQVMEQAGLAASKRFGQNFLIDRSVRTRIADALETSPGMLVWEIGPGIGAMTGLMLGRGARLVAFEIDYGFVRFLRELYGTHPDFTVVEGDMLKTWRSQPDKPDRIFGNLPYNAAFPIIADLLERDCVPPVMVFTLQKEAAHRLVARPGTKDYSSLSILCASVCQARILFDIGASSFWPQPRVTSSVVKLVPSSSPVPVEFRRDFSRFVRAAFSTRRKTLRNALQVWAHAQFPGLSDNAFSARLAQALADLGKPPESRAEALGPAELFQLFRLLGPDGAAGGSLSQRP
ncbi:MAG: 16S rRNA (adenine(1518)-N(6)/adenine(1519)-N(6))-dimethyltransferase RsmA, partial [Rectinema sp.]|nr:16S rRNA (adenine(1518)-N(6)/adenine(1519)-N(6))-dimethyltransferase RsmA [Rectinema sp.]